MPRCLSSLIRGFELALSLRTCSMRLRAFGWDAGQASTGPRGVVVAEPKELGDNRMGWAVRQMPVIWRPKSWCL
jgi:hypothetical protein